MRQSGWRRSACAYIVMVTFSPYAVSLPIVTYGGTTLIGAATWRVTADDEPEP